MINVKEIYNIGYSSSYQWNGFEISQKLKVGAFNFVFSVLTFRRGKIKISVPFRASKESLKDWRTQRWLEYQGIKKTHH